MSQISYFVVCEEAKQIHQVQTGRQNYYNKKWRGKQRRRINSKDNIKEVNEFLAEFELV